MPTNTLLKKYNYQLILIIVSFILYGNTLKNGYALDDEFVTGPNNITMKGFKAIPKIFSTFHVIDEVQNSYEYRPMVKVSFAIQHQFFGDDLIIAHLVNILLYAVSLILVLRFLKLLFKQYPSFILFAVTLIFAFLPIHSEVVDSLKNRDVLLSFIFLIASFTSILKYADDRKWRYVLFAILFLGISFLSKFEAVPFLIIIPFVLLKRNNVGVKQIAVVVLVFFLGYISYKLTKFTLLDKKGGAVRVFQYFENPLFFEHSLTDKLSAALNSLGFYSKMLLWPSNMASYYGYNVVKVFSFTTVFACIGLICFCGLAYVFFKRFKKPDVLWYGVLFFSTSISMYLNIVVPAPGIVADRFLFFASLGFCLMAGHFLFYYKNIPKKNIGFSDLKLNQKAIPLFLFVVFSFVIINRNKEWKNKDVLFEADAKKYPESVKLALLTTSQLIINISDPKKAQGMTDGEKIKKIREGEQLLKKAIQTDSSCGGCYNNLSFMYLTFERQPAEALPYLKLAYKRDTTKKEVICNIGIAYFRLGQVDFAKQYLKMAIRHDKKGDFSVPYEVLQDLYTRTNPAEGVAFLKEKLDEGVQPELMNVLLGKTYFEAKDTLNSIYFYKASLEINPNNSNVSDFVTKLEVKFNKKAW